MTPLLPPNATATERSIAQAAADATGLSVFASLWNPATCPAAALPALAWALRVDEWSDDWPVETQRRVCADAIEIHRRRGTRASIERALRSVGIINDAFGWTAQIDEGITGLRYDGSEIHDGARDYGSDVSWASYIVTINRPLSIAEAQIAQRVLKATAPARCELAEFNFEGSAYTYNGAQTYDGAVTHGAI